MEMRSPVKGERATVQNIFLKKMREEEVRKRTLDKFRRPGGIGEEDENGSRE